MKRCRRCATELSTPPRAGWSCPCGGFVVVTEEQMDQQEQALRELARQGFLSTRGAS